MLIRPATYVLFHSLLTPIIMFVALLKIISFLFVEYFLLVDCSDIYLIKK